MISQTHPINLLLIYALIKLKLLGISMRMVSLILLKKNSSKFIYCSRNYATKSLQSNKWPKKILCLDFLKINQ